MKNRIKKLRKELNLTQQEFADKIGISRGNIGAYEVGKNAPSDAVISLISREFNVNEEWLQTGKGEMFKPNPSDILEQMARKYQFSKTDYAIVDKYINLSPSKRKEVVENVFGFMREIEAALSGIDPHAPAYGNEPPLQTDALLSGHQEYSGIPDSVAAAEAVYEKSLGIAPRKESSVSNTTGGTEKKNA